MFQPRVQECMICCPLVGMEKITDMFITSIWNIHHNYKVIFATGCCHTLKAIWLGPPCVPVSNPKGSGPGFCPVFLRGPHWPKSCPQIPFQVVIANVSQTTHFHTSHTTLLNANLLVVFYFAYHIVWLCACLWLLTFLFHYVGGKCNRRKDKL